jgi:hypothetical protein
MSILRNLMGTPLLESLPDPVAGGCDRLYRSGSVFGFCFGTDGKYSTTQDIYNGWLEVWTSR